MHTPAGFTIENGVFMVDDWWEIVFNPSFKYRFIHVVLASLLTASFFVAGISALRARKNVDGPATWKVIRTGVFFAAVLAPLQIFVGDMHGLVALENQPAKIAAVEGIWETEKGAPLTLFGFPDEEARTTHFAIEVPKMASIILTHHADGEIKGLNEFEDAHPPVAPLFWSFRVMVGVGFLMLAIAWWGSYALLKDRVGPWLLRALSGMTFAGWVATLAGWYVTEIGRQPWVVQGYIRASEVVADHAGGMILSTLIGYLALYAFLLVFYIFSLHYLSSKPARSLRATIDFAANKNAATGAA
jgi:cytochrome d ubiquinol oxidase subunit I